MSNTNNDLIFDSSTLTTYERCPRQFYWRYVQHLAPMDIPIPLSYGSALHEALHEWYKNHDEESAISVFHANWTDLFHESNRTADSGEILLRGYFKKYRREPFLIVSLEKAFSINLNGFQYCGRFDAIVFWDNKHYIMDHKHTTRLTKNYFGQYRPNLQISGYVWAAQQIYDLELFGAVINLIHITKESVKNVDNGAPFVRNFIPREGWEIEQFKEQATHLMSEASSLDPEDRDCWRMCWTACNDYSGCVYRDLCVDHEPEKLIPTHFTVRKWSPLNDTNAERIQINAETEKSNIPFPRFWEK